MNFKPALLALTLALTSTALADLVEQWQKAAVRKHPTLATSGSPLNQRFLAIVAEKKASEPGFFQKPDWPMRAADAAAEAVKKDEKAAAEKAKVEEAQMAEEKERAAEQAELEKSWEVQKAKWVFDRLVFGDDEATVIKKLNLSKLVTARSSGGARVALSSRYRWVIGEHKFDLDFEMSSGFKGLTISPLPESTADLDSLIKEDWTALRAAAIERFGAPTKSTPFPAAAQLKKGALTATDTWEQATRTITLGVAEDDGKGQATLKISAPGGR
jgi:hypothetical protein